MPGAGSDTAARAGVVIAGGGIAALEALIALHQTAPAHTRVTLVTPERRLPYRPLSVAQPFGLAAPVELDVGRIAHENGAKLVEDFVDTFEPERDRVVLRSGRRLDYDSLLIAIGARPRPALPGAITFGGPPDAPALTELVDRVDAGDVRSVAFAVPEGVRWTLPLYELALLTAAHTREVGADVALALVTHEKRPLQMFGPRTADQLERLLAEARISLHPGTTAVAVHPGRLLVTPRGVVEAEAVVALARLVAPRLPGLPQRRGGFLAVDEYGRVDGLANVYAAGDITWYPVKQGGLAAQQADAAAASIAADAGAPVERFPFEPRLRGLLLTGRAPQFLRGETTNGSAGGPDGPRWSSVGKVAGRYLTPYLAGRGIAGVPSPGA